MMSNRKKRKLFSKRPARKPAFFYLKGFTLIELVITLVIVGILSVAVTPAIFDALKRTQLNACAEQLASHLRYARNMAIAGASGGSAANGVVVVFTNTATQKYEVKYCAGGGPGTFLSDPLDSSKNFSVVLNDLNARREFAGITFASGTSPPATGESLVFDTTGTPFTNCALTTRVSTPAFVRLQNSKGDTRTVYITPRAGMVFVR